MPGLWGGSQGRTRTHRCLPGVGWEVAEWARQSPSISTWYPVYTQRPHSEESPQSQEMEMCPAWGPGILRRMERVGLMLEEVYLLRESLPCDSSVNWDCEGDHE